VAAEQAAGVGHHVALSVVGAKELSESGDPATTMAGYFWAKLTQETLVKASPIPYTIVQATHFFESLEAIADRATYGETIVLPSVLFQPVAADDVADAVGRVATGAPVNGVVEVAGPEQFRLDMLVRRYLSASNDARVVLSDPSARYLKAHVAQRTLVPGQHVTLGEVRFDDWLHRSTAATAAV
jgi:uncharacterized protein YbjT (DUF2867 family)